MGIKHNTSVDLKNCLFLPKYFYTSIEFDGEAFRMSAYSMLGLGCILSILIVSINGLFLTTIARKSALRTPPNILLCSLATVDCLTGLLSIPLYIGWVVDIKLFRSCLYTRVILLVMFVIFGASFFTIVGVCIERYIALFYSLQYHNIVTKNRIYVTIILIWSYPTFINILFVTIGNLEVLLIGSLVNIFFGNSIIISTYFKVFKLVRRHHRQIQTQQARTVQTSFTGSTTGQRKHAITMAVVIGSMMCCYCPLCCLYAFVLKKGIDQQLAVSALFCIISALSNSLWNPLIYCWRNREIKAAIVEQLLIIKTLFTGF